MPQGLEARARRVQRRDEVKARLGAAMLTVARDRPFSAITVEEIAKAAGISRSTFYFYYRDKSELLVETARSASDELFSHAEEFWQAEGDRRELVRGGLTMAAGTFADHRDLIRVTMEASTYDERVAEFWQGCVERFAAAVAERIRTDQREGTIAADLDAERLAGVLVAAAQGYLLRGAGRNGEGPDEAAGVLADVWIRVLYPG
jgi:AcrR family transcriptional regulator